MKRSFPANTKRIIFINGIDLKPEELFEIGYHNVALQISPKTTARVAASRAVVDGIISSNKVVYGINTGFGNFSNVVIDDTKLAMLQENLIKSHAVGVGEPLTIPRTKMMFALRINVLAKGYSGITVQTLERLVEAFNLNLYSVIPCQGTVGASGDLAPLAHLAAGLLGYGEIWDLETNAPVPAAEMLKRAGFSPLVLHAKEGLAMINGTQFITALGCEAVVRARELAIQADVIAGMTIEVLLGTSRALDPRIHEARPHVGQNKVAERIRTVLGESNKSELSQSHHECGKVQDSYTLRCVPQVHGICHDTVDFVYGVLMTEANSGTDNPMIFVASEEKEADVISGGNFHGEYPAKALDYLGIGISEIGSISERRIERLVNPSLSGLPAFLVDNGGLNSGMMMAHVTAASLVSENKVLSHPSSVDSISTSAAQEDHVSMGGFSARKAIRIVENIEKILAIELICACQALDYHRPLKTTPVLERVHALVREMCPKYEEDRFLAPDIQAVAQLLRSGEIVSLIE